MTILAMTLLLAGSLGLPAEAAKDTYNTSQTLDATKAVVTSDGSNVNGVTSLGVSFIGMTEVEDARRNESIGSSGTVLVSADLMQEKNAVVLQFQKPIDANKLEYLHMGIFAGEGCKIRVYGSDVTNFIEDTAGDVFTFATYGVEKKTLVLKKYADEDGYVRNLTLYVPVAASPNPCSLIIDYFTFEEYQTAATDLVLKATVNTHVVNQDLGEGQIPTFQLRDEGVLKRIGWDSAIYIDGTQERIWKPGRYVKLSFDRVNIKDYETIVVDVCVEKALDFTLYAYDATEMNYTRKNADQIVTVTGGEATTMVFDAAKFADESGYVSEINLLLAEQSDETIDGFQAFFGDITFKLPREYAKVTVYTEKLSGGYEKSDVSTTLEGFAGDTVKITPYSAEELGLYGYTYNASAGNVLSGVYTEDKVIELKLYYRLKDCTVTICNDGETIKKTVKYGSELDLMEYRKENMILNVLMDGLQTNDTSLCIKEDCVIDITQTAGNYVYFMVDDEVYEILTYTPDNMTITEPLVPIKVGYVGAWEEYVLDGKDVTVHAVYTETSVSTKETKDTSAFINVATDIKDMAKTFPVLAVVLAGLAIALIAVLAVVIVKLVRSGKISRRQLVIGGVATAVCCVAVVVGCCWNLIFGGVGTGSQTAQENYTFEQLYSSDEANSIKPDETLTYEIDKELKDKNYIEIDVDTDVNLFGTIEYYNLADENQTNVEEFFIEGASEDTFYQFLDNFRTNGSGQFEKHLTKITLTNVSEEDGTVTVNKVAISDRSIDLTKAEVYVENEYLKVGMDLMCGGALTYLERLPQDDEVVQEVLDADGNVAIGLNYGDKDGAELLNESVNLINIYDRGREIQQSYYAIIGEESGYTNGSYNGNDAWPYNPVQGGDQYENMSQIIDYRVEDNLLYVKTRAMDWSLDNSTTKSYMENWYSLDEDMLYVTNRFIDWNGFEGESEIVNNEMPAVYFAQAFDHIATYNGNNPWTNDTLDIQNSVGKWTGDTAHRNTNPSEGWFAWVNEEHFGIGVYVPGIKSYVSGRSMPETSGSIENNQNAYKSTMLTDYRPDPTSMYASCYVSNCSYTAPVLRTTMDWYVPLEYTYVIKVDNLEDIRRSFQTLDQSGAIDNSDLTIWD